MTDYKLGRLKSPDDSRQLKLTTYLDTTVLPKTPAKWGHDTLVPSAKLGMLGNDKYGDCVWAGAAHESMLFNAAADKAVLFTDTSVLSDYAAVTGFNPLTGKNDDGTDPVTAAKYRQKTGVLDADGNRHKIGAYLSIEPDDLDTLELAGWLFHAVGLGINFPSYAMDEFNAGKEWTYKPKNTIEGGHYIPLVQKDTHLQIITWGAYQPVSPAFITHFCDEALVYISEEMLTGGKTLEGFNAAQLTADLAALKH